MRVELRGGGEGSDVVIDPEVVLVSGVFVIHEFDACRAPIVRRRQFAHRIEARGAVRAFGKRVQYVFPDATCT